MPITINRVGDLYEAHVTPPHGAEWRSPPMSTDRLVAALLERICHQTDVGDAFYEADPRWDRPGRLRLLKALRDVVPHRAGR
jgi:hypothetical protein